MEREISTGPETGTSRSRENKVENVSMGRSKKGTLNINQDVLLSAPGDAEKSKDGLRRMRPEQEESRLLNFLMSTYDRNIVDFFMVALDDLFCFVIFDIFYT